MYQIYITEYIVVFWLNDILVSSTTQRDGSYQKEVFISKFSWLFLYRQAVYFHDLRRWLRSHFGSSGETVFISLVVIMLTDISMYFVLGFLVVAGIMRK
jgi:hypothetical protein